MKKFDQHPNHRDPVPWEPQPLHLPVEPPRPRDRVPSDTESERERGRKVIIIDLA